MSKNPKPATPIPYVSEWDLNSMGRPIGAFAAFVKMLAGWIGWGIPSELRRFQALPGPTLFKDELDALGLACHLEFPASPLSILCGDICLVNYQRIPPELVQDKHVYGWAWVIYLHHDDAHVYVHDPNWGGSARDGGDRLAIPLEEWAHVFTPHVSGLQAIRLNVRGQDPQLTPPTPEPEPPTEEPEPPVEEPEILGPERLTQEFEPLVLEP